MIVSQQWSQLSACLHEVIQLIKSSNGEIEADSPVLKSTIASLHQCLLDEMVEPQAQGREERLLELLQSFLHSKGLGHVYDFCTEVVLDNRVNDTVTLVLNLVLVEKRMSELFLFIMSLPEARALYLSQSVMRDLQFLMDAIKLTGELEGLPFKIQALWIDSYYEVKDRRSKVSELSFARKLMDIQSKRALNARNESEGQGSVGLSSEPFDLEQMEKRIRAEMKNESGKKVTTVSEKDEEALKVGPPLGPSKVNRLYNELMKMSKGAKEPSIKEQPSTDTPTPVLWDDKYIFDNFIEKHLHLRVSTKKRADYHQVKGIMASSCFQCRTALHSNILYVDSSDQRRVL